MNSFVIVIPSEVNIPLALSQALSEMPSLSAAPAKWAEYLKNLSHGHHIVPPYVTDIAAHWIVWYAAERIDELAEVDYEPIGPRPSAATYISEEGVFVTPEGDRVMICKSKLEKGQNHYSPNGVVLSIDLSPKSEHLATIILAQLLRHVPAAAPLLVKAAKAAMKKKM